MEKYIKNYIDSMEIHGIVRSELSGREAHDIHHIKYRSRGGDDSIENLIALTRDEHDRAHYKKKPYLTPEYLSKIHLQFLKQKKYL